jgi:hypothetical protein
MRPEQQAQTHFLIKQQLVIIQVSSMLGKGYNIYYKIN